MTCLGCAVECWDFPTCLELVDREHAATAEAEASGLAFAGADHQPNPTAIAAARAATRERLRRTTNQARYGTGGLFDQLEAS